MIKTISRLPKNLKIFLFLLVLISGAYVSSWALGYGQNNNSDGLVVDIALSANNYNTDTKIFSDQSGNGNDANSLNVAVFGLDKYGKSEGAMSFNGSSDVVTISNTNKNYKTKSLWFYSTSNSEQVIAGGILGSPYFSLVYTGNKLSIAGAGGNSEKVITQNTFSPYQWHHVVVLRTESDFPDNFRIFVNGEEQSLVPGGAYRACSGARVGARYSGGNFSVFFNGSIKNVMAWDRELSLEEIQRLYQDDKPKVQASSITSGLIGYWPLNGDNYNPNTSRVTDKSAYSNHGTNSGATLVEGRFGKSEGAMSFNGSNNRISIDYQNPINQTSVSAWFKSTGAPAGGYHIITGGANVEISINHSGGYIRTGVTTNTQGRRVFNSGSGLTDGNWHQVAFTYDGENLKSFIDGQLTATNSVSGNLVGTAQEIGRYLSNSYVANGFISDVRIYNRAISEDEIKLIYNSYIPQIVTGSLQKGLILDMPLTAQYAQEGEAGSEIIIDKSPYSHNGQNYGATLSGGSASFSSDLEPLLMDYRIWKDGQSGSIGSFTAWSSGNSRIMAEDPWGRNVVVWETGESNDPSYPAQGGIYYNYSQLYIDNTKTYRMSWWEKRVTNAAGTYGRYYAGLNGYGSTNGVINLTNGAYNNNPYFTMLQHFQLTEGQWFLVVGHVFPYTHTGTTNHPDSATYTVDGFLQNNYYGDYKWAPETTRARSRTLAIYRGSDSDMVHYTVYPRMEVVDGTEPSIQELLDGYDSYGHDIVVTVPEDKVSFSFWYASPSSNGWVHVVNSAGTFYVNGEIGAPAQYPIVVSGDQVYIGRTTMSDYFEGAISNLKIYNRALSSVEIQSLYDQGKTERGIILGGN